MCLLTNYTLGGQGGLMSSLVLEVEDHTGYSRCEAQSIAIATIG